LRLPPLGRFVLLSSRCQEAHEIDEFVAAESVGEAGRHERDGAGVEFLKVTVGDGDEL